MPGKGGVAPGAAGFGRGASGRRATTGQTTRKRASKRPDAFVEEELKALGWTEGDLRRQRKGDKRKVAAARRLRKEMTMGSKLTAERLHMGSWTDVSNLLHQTLGN